MEKLQASLLTPAKQGELDSLCGLYSVINTLYWFYGQKVRRKSLFRALVHHLSQHSSIADYLTNGMESPQIDCLLHFLQTSRYKRYPIAVYRPFLTQPNVSTKAILAQCQEGLSITTASYCWAISITGLLSRILMMIGCVFLTVVHVSIFTGIVGHYVINRGNISYSKMPSTLLSRGNSHDLN